MLQVIRYLKNPVKSVIFLTSLNNINLNFI